MHTGWPSSNMPLARSLRAEGPGSGWKAVGAAVRPAGAAESQRPSRSSKEQRLSHTHLMVESRTVPLRCAQSWEGERWGTARKSVSGAGGHRSLSLHPQRNRPSALSIWLPSAACAPRPWAGGDTKRAAQNYMPSGQNRGSGGCRGSCANLWTPWRVAGESAGAGSARPQHYRRAAVHAERHQSRRRDPCALNTLAKYRQMTLPMAAGWRQGTRACARRGGAARHHKRGVPCRISSGRSEPQLGQSQRQIQTRQTSVHTVSKCPSVR